MWKRNESNVICVRCSGPNRISISSPNATSITLSMKFPSASAIRWTFGGSVSGNGWYPFRIPEPCSRKLKPGFMHGSSSTMEQMQQQPTSRLWVAELPSLQICPSMFKRAEKIVSTKFGLYFVLFTVLSLAIAAQPAFPAAANKKVTIIFAYFSERAGLVFVAKDQRFFDEQGLDVDVV